MGADCVVTEMVSTAGVARGSERSMRLLRFHERERPIGAQLFGHTPRDFEHAAAVVSEMGFSFIDVNAGCPARKVVSGGSGAALLDDPALLLEIVRAVAGSARLPVTVKIRLGRDPRRSVPESLPEDLHEAGCRALAVHGRYESEGFGGPVRHSEIARLSELSPMPVVANGDSGSMQAVLELRRRSRASGALLGRGAARNPWIFRGLSGDGEPRPGPGELRKLVLYQLDMMEEYLPRRTALMRLRGHLSRYLRGFRGASELRERAVRVDTRRDVERVLDMAEGRFSAAVAEKAHVQG
jgi:nifR3 family TIM-barrel protein